MHHQQFGNRKSDIKFTIILLFNYYSFLNSGTCITQATAGSIGRMKAR